MSRKLSLAPRMTSAEFSMIVYKVSALFFSKTLHKLCPYLKFKSGFSLSMETHRMSDFMSPVSPLVLFSKNGFFLP